MKHILLSLVFLSSIPVAGLSAAAGAAVDAKTKAADVSASAGANPTATVGNSASAAAVPEAEAKRNGAEVDVKSDNSHFSLDQIHSSVIPTLNAYFPEQVSYLVAGGVGKKEDMTLLAHQQYGLLERWLVNRALEVAQPSPSWQSIKEYLQKGFEQHGVGFLPDLINIVIDYAQGDLEPIREIFKKFIMVREFGPEYLSHISLAMGVKHPTAEYHRSIVETQGVVFMQDKQTLDKWRRGGFEFQPQLYQTDTLRCDRVVCLACRNSYKTPRERGNYIDPTGRAGHLFGDVTGTSLFWRDPLCYHRKGCKTATKIKKNMAEQGVAQPSSVPILRTHPQAFAGYILLQLDLWARRFWRDSRDVTPDYTEAVQGWVMLVDSIVMMRVPYELSTYAFVRDPQAWVDLQNKRAEELGSSVRYKLPEKPVTK